MNSWAPLSVLACPCLASRLICCFRWRVPMDRVNAQAEGSGSGPARYPAGRTVPFGGTAILCDGTIFLTTVSTCTGTRTDSGMTSRSTSKKAA
jgi:hypothetical protein